MADAFISYRRKPSATLALLIQKEFHSKYSLNAYVDTTRTDSTHVQFPERLMQAIADSPVFICLLGEGTLDSEWVRKEIRQAHQLGKRCIPVFQESYSPLEATEPAIKYLLSFDGVHVLDVKNIYVDEAIAQLANRLGARVTSDISESEAAQADQVALRELFQYLKFEIINNLLQGFFDEKIWFKFIDHFDEYLEMRKNPKYQLYDNKLEQLLKDFDRLLDTMLCEATGYIVHDHQFPGHLYIPLYMVVSGNRAKDERGRYLQFLENHVRPTYSKYQELTEELKTRRIYHRII